MYTQELCKDLWSYCHPQHKKVTGEMIAIDSQSFSIVEDMYWFPLNFDLSYAVPLQKYFIEKVILEFFLPSRRS